MPLKYVGVEVQRHSSLASTLAIGEWSASRPDRLTWRMHMPQSSPGRFKEKKNLLPLRDTKSGSSKPQRSDYTDYAAPLHIT
jgi:hypothetical protein